jgi:hypothetical protein
MKSAELYQFVAIRAVDLYVLYLLNAAGRLDVDRFWQELFDTNGVFNSKPYYEMYDVL